MEQILIRQLPVGTKAALRSRAESHGQSLEAEARAILSEALRRQPATLVDLVSVPEGVEIEFEPDRLGLASRSADL